MKFFLSLILFVSIFLGVRSVWATNDRRALSAPSSVEQSMDKLVNHLIDGETKEYERAKLIAIWIATHIAYDNYSYAAAVGKKSGFRPSSRLEIEKQDADSVFKIRIATCDGFANLYEKMLSKAGIKSQKIYGFSLTDIPSSTKAKQRIRSERVGHVWNRVYLSQGDILVDVTYMGKGRVGQEKKMLTPHQKKQDLRNIKQNKMIYEYRNDYFDFRYEDLQKKGEYRFDGSKKILKR